MNNNKLQLFRENMLSAKESLNSIATKHLTAEKIVRLANLSAKKNPRLLECTSISVLNCVAACCQLGIEFDSPLQHAHLIPYKKDCTLIIGYRGFIELARRSGKIKSIEARVVYKEDDFEVEFGLEPKIKHIPNYGSERKKEDIVAAYAIAHFTDGGYQFEVLTLAEIQKARQSSKAANNGPWVNWFEEMAKKTALRKLAKYLPLTPEMAQAEAYDSSNDVLVKTKIEVLDDSDTPLFSEDTIDVEAEEKQENESQESKIFNKLAEGN